MPPPPRKRLYSTRNLSPPPHRVKRITRSLSDEEIQPTPPSSPSPPRAGSHADHIGQPSFNGHRTSPPATDISIARSCPPSGTAQACRESTSDASSAQEQLNVPQVIENGPPPSALGEEAAARPRRSTQRRSLSTRSTANAPLRDTPSRRGPQGDGRFVFRGQHYRTLETYAAACLRFDAASYIGIEVTVRVKPFTTH